MARAIGSASGPLLPIHVVQPYPTTWNPSASRSAIRPDSLRYSVTTFEPGAMLVFTQGLRSRPSSRALRAMRPAPIITDGLEVLVQLVMAAITTEPSLIVNRSPPYSTSARVVPASATGAAAAGLRPPSSAHREPSCSAMERRAPVGMRFGSTVLNESFSSLSGTRSCGRRGPASDGTTESRSSSTTLV